MTAITFIFKYDDRLQTGKILLNEYDEKCILDLYVKDYVLSAINTYRFKKRYTIILKNMKLGITGIMKDIHNVYIETDSQLFDLYLDCLDIDKTKHTYHYEDETEYIDYTKI